MIQIENFDCIDTYVTPDMTHRHMHPRIHGGHHGAAKKPTVSEHDRLTVKAQVLKEVINKTAKDTNTQRRSKVGATFCLHFAECGCRPSQGHGNLRYPPKAIPPRQIRPY